MKQLRSADPRLATRRAPRRRNAPTGVLCAALVAAALALTAAPRDARAQTFTGSGFAEGFLAVVLPGSLAAIAMPVAITASVGSAVWLGRTGYVPLAWSVTGVASGPVWLAGTAAVLAFTYDTPWIAAVAVSGLVLSAASTGFSIYALTRQPSRAAPARAARGRSLAGVAPELSVGREAGARGGVSLAFRF